MNLSLFQLTVTTLIFQKNKKEKEKEGTRRGQSAQEATE
jgi:hypothetical protein